MAQTNTNCVFFEADGGCRYCGVGFTNNRGVCVAGLSNCLLQAGPKCKKCARGYTLTTQNTDSLATYVNSGLYNNQGQNIGSLNIPSYKCVPVGISNCAAFTASNTCQTCQAGFYLDTTYSTCRPAVRTISFCAKYSSAVACGQCQSGYYLSTDNSACISALLTIPNCAYYTSPSICKECNPGFYVQYSSAMQASCIALTNNGVSLAIPFCAAHVVQNGQALSSITCARCNIPYYPSADGKQCISSSQNTFATISSCRSYINSGTCQSCLTGYYLAGNSCLPVTRVIPYCDTYATATTCSLCQAGTSLSANGLCYYGTVSGCAYYIQSGATFVCQQCVNGFYLNTATSPASCIASTVNGGLGIPNCLYQSTNDACAVCNEGYKLSNQVAGYTAGCVINSIPSNCAVQTSATQCLYCSTGLYQTSPNACSNVVNRIA